MILVFKTSVETQEQVIKIEPVLNTLFPEPSAWNFDLDDCDFILRISACDTVTAETVIAAITQHGFCCEELTD